MDQVDLLAMCRAPGVSWHFLAREAQRPEGMERLRAGLATEDSSDATKSLAALASARDDLGERQRTCGTSTSSRRRPAPSPIIRSCRTCGGSAGNGR